MEDVTLSLMRPARLARELDEPEPKVREWIRDGLIPSIRIGRATWALNPDEVRRVLLGH